ncbi:hypothetical protein SAMN05421820_112196 [Pedobacter steynii]|uniref:DUF3828 domain-containing protein n=1 Tax=Pedobacter steynii TaxID=430522 RepID=A0A1H0HN11_9SPHI|nr:hypothetical protein [Pedobacter steynii]NQX42565.1 hypothetical protein [Pedobacter steynii]SDO20413.1 hypothetical protein SAMN05421820_112196 [Pedobacter steynii]
MNLKTLAIILFALFFYSCNVGTTRTWNTENINKDTKGQIKALNDSLMKCIKNNDLAGLRSLLSDALMEKSGNDMEQFVKQVGLMLKTTGYKVLNEQYANNSAVGLDNNIPVNISSDQGYTIHYKALNKEMYVSLLLPEGLTNELLITAIYGKYGEDWKLNIIQFGSYSVMGKKAPDYYKMAKESYGKANLIDAVNYSWIATRLLQPANAFIQYQKQSEITAFQLKVTKEANGKYQMPLVLDQIPGKPEVFRIYPEVLGDGIYPMVYYRSRIKLADTAALRVENEAVKKEVNRIFKGINEDKQAVLYWAFNELPDGQKRVEHFGFADKIKD